LKVALAASGFDCTTVQEAGWLGKENGELLALADFFFGDSLNGFFSLRITPFPEFKNVFQTYPTRLGITRSGHISLT
jgi:hypothetical protein